MSDLIQQAVERLNEKTLSDLTATVKFNIKDEGYLVICNDGAFAEDREADVTLSTSAKTFEGLMNGTQDAKMAFMMGKIKLKGDMSAAMQLSKILG